IRQVINRTSRLAWFRMIMFNLPKRLVGPLSICRIQCPALMIDAVLIFQHAMEASADTEIDILHPHHSRD
ncbi:MAG TPA: hypothetical protein VGC26_02745, partial [Afipia sp.]